MFYVNLCSMFYIVYCILCILYSIFHLPALMKDCRFNQHIRLVVAKSPPRSCVASFY